MNSQKIKDTFELMERGTCYWVKCAQKHFVLFEILKNHKNSLSPWQKCSEHGCGNDAELLEISLACPFPRQPIPYCKGCAIKKYSRSG